MTPFPTGRAAVGLLALAAAAPDAVAFDFHPRKHCADTTRVTIPARDVEVVTEQPRVVVRETASREVASRVRRSADLGIVPLGTLYMPTIQPTFAVGIGGPVGVTDFGGVGVGSRALVREEEEYNPLEAAHRAERQLAKTARVQAELEFAMDAHKRVLNRITGTGSRAADCPPGGGSTSAAVDEKLRWIEDELKKLNDRVTQVEKLVIYHDNMLQKMPAPRSVVAPEMSQPLAPDGTRTAAPPANPGGAPTMAPPLPPK